MHLCVSLSMQWFNTSESKYVFLVGIDWLFALFDVDVGGSSSIVILCAAIFGAWLGAIWTMFVL